MYKEMEQFAKEELKDVGYIILQLLEENPLTVEEIANIIGRSTYLVAQFVKAARDAGKVAVVPTGDGAVFIALIDDGYRVKYLHSLISIYELEYEAFKKKKERARMIEEEENAKIIESAMDYEMKEVSKKKDKAKINLFGEIKKSENINNKLAARRTKYR